MISAMLPSHMLNQLRERKVIRRVTLTDKVPIACSLHSKTQVRRASFSFDSFRCLWDRLLAAAVRNGWAIPLAALCCPPLHIREREIPYNATCSWQSLPNEARQCSIQAHLYQTSNAGLGDLFLLFIIPVLFYTHYNFLFLYALHCQLKYATFFFFPKTGTCVKCKYVQSSYHILTHSSTAIAKEPVATPKTDKKEAAVTGASPNLRPHTSPLAANNELHAAVY